MTVEITGTIVGTTITEGTSSSGKEWTRIDVAIEEDGAQYDEGANIAFFNKVGAEKLEKGMRVKAFFNLKLNKSKAGDKYFTNLGGWKWEVLESGEAARLDKPNESKNDSADDLPF